MRSMLIPNIMPNPLMLHLAQWGANRPGWLNTQAPQWERTDQALTLQQAVPGLTHEQVNVSIEENVLQVQVQSSNEHISTQRWHLPDNVAIDKAAATVKNGLLSVVLPFKEPQRHVIAVQAA